MIDELVNKNAEQIDFSDMLSDPTYNSCDLCFSRCKMNIKIDIVTYHISFNCRYVQMIYTYHYTS